MRISHSYRSTSQSIVRSSQGHCVVAYAHPCFAVASHTSFMFHHVFLDVDRCIDHLPKFMYILDHPVLF